MDNSRQAVIKTFRRKRGAKEEKVTTLRVGAIALASALVMMFLAINNESTYGSARYFRTNTSDFVAIQSGSRSNVENSIIPSELIADLKAIDGVEVAGQSYVFKQLGGRDVLYMTYQAGEPTQPLLASGRHLARDYEVVVDEGLASAQAISLEQNVSIFGSSYKVVGLSAQTGSFGKEIVFVSNLAIGRFFNNETVFNTLAIKTNGNDIPQAVRDKWSARQIDIISQQEFVDGIVGYWTRNVTPLIISIIEVVSIIALLGLVVILLKQLELQMPTIGIMRAIGTTARQIAAIEALAMAIMAATGFVLSIGLGYLLVLYSNLTTPGFHAALSLNDIAISATIILSITAEVIIATWRKTRKSTPLQLIRK